MVMPKPEYAAIFLPLVLVYSSTSLYYITWENRDKLQLALKPGACVITQTEEEGMQRLARAGVGRWPGYTEDAPGSSHANPGER
jgi:hypothetical protein